MSKKSIFFPFLLALLLVLPVFATGSAPFTFALEVNGSASATIAPDETITVTLVMTSTEGEGYTLYNMQDYICFDTEYFSYVEDSIQSDELFKASPIDFNTGECQRVFVNRIANTAYEVGEEERIEVVSFQLKALKTGTTTLSHDRVEMLSQTNAEYEVTQDIATVTIASASTGSSGGSSGGTSGGVSSSTADTETTGDDSAATVTVTPTTSTSDTTASAVVADTSLEAAIDEAVTEAGGADSHVEIVVEATDRISTVTVELSTSALETVAESDVTALTITSQFGSITVPSDAISELVAQAVDTSIVVIIEEVDSQTNLNEAQKSAVGDSLVIDLSVMSGGVKITSFGGHELMISLPYQLQVGESAENIVVWYFDDYGNITPMDTTYDEETGIATFTTSHFSLYAVVHDGNVFTDVDINAYYYNAVLWASENGITSGLTETLFSPDTTCTRAQAVTFLYRAAGEPEVTGENPFTDVDEDDYYYSAILWAVSEGITVGTSDVTFSPNDDCTRSQIVTFLYRAAGEPEVVGENPFADVSADTYYYGAVLWAVSEGITAGTTTTTFEPNTDCTRGQIVTFLYRSVGA